MQQIYAEEDSQMKRAQALGKIARRRLREPQGESEAVTKVPLEYRVYIKKYGMRYTIYR